ncbi:MAG: DUF4336 domain-containing protein [Myxococcota bacterium]
MKEIATDVYEVSGEIRMTAGWYFPLRTVIVRLEDGALWVHSPVRLTDELAESVNSLGPVRTIVAPNNLHHVFAGKWKSRWPDAELIGAKGLVKKRPDLQFDGTLDQESVQFPGIERVFLAGAPTAGETVFFHRASKTFICTDLIFNLDGSNTKGWLTGIILRLASAYGGPAQSRLVRLATKDRARAGESVAKMLEWPFERIAMCHGHVVEENAQDTLRHACRWMLAGAT